MRSPQSPISPPLYSNLCFVVFLCVYDRIEGDLCREVWMDSASWTTYSKTYTGCWSLIYWFAYCFPLFISYSHLNSNQLFLGSHSCGTIHRKKILHWLYLPLWFGWSLLYTRGRKKSQKILSIRIRNGNYCFNSFVLKKFQLDTRGERERERETRD